MAKLGEKDGDQDKASGGVRGDLIDEICKQIESHLPIRSLDDLLKKVDGIKVGSSTIPLKLIARHVSKDAFPVKDARDLKEKVSEGAKRAVSLGRSSACRVNTEFFNQAIGELTQTEAKIGLMRPAVYQLYYRD